MSYIKKSLLTIDWFYFFNNFKFHSLSLVLSIEIIIKIYKNS